MNSSKYFFYLLLFFILLKHTHILLFINKLKTLFKLYYRSIFQMFIVITRFIKYISMLILFGFLLQSQFHCR